MGRISVLVSKLLAIAVTLLFFAVCAYIMGAIASYVVAGELGAAVKWPGVGGDSRRAGTGSVRGGVPGEREQMPEEQGLRPKEGALLAEGGAVGHKQASECIQQGRVGRGGGGAGMLGHGIGLRYGFRVVVLHHYDCAG